MKPRILWVNECSVLQTGYATYGREVLKRLHSTDKYDLAEHAVYINSKDPRIQQIPWTIYANLPDKEDKKQEEIYRQNAANQFGEWRFDEICLDFKPHILMDIRDFWMCSFEYRSPLRPYYNWVIMPTVDAYPQNEEWLSTYSDADGVFTYQDWSRKVLDDEGGGRIKTLGSASPAADDTFRPLNNIEVKKEFGLEEFEIVGTVMRNQRRKLYPDLFEGFAQFLKNTNKEKTLLYCHTSYPDMGWDTPKLLLKYGLTSKVLFTYICRECGYAFPNFFSDVLCSCPKCRNLSGGMSNVQQGVNNETLTRIINLFDLYVQYANSEGFGMPQLEAAACGVPIMSIDYSAMSDAVRKLGGRELKPLTLTIEMETGCYRAIPDNDLLAKRLQEFFATSKDYRQKLRIKTRQNYDKHYSWDRTAQTWERYFNTIDIDKYEKEWHSEPKFYNPPSEYPTQITNKDFAAWLILNVLHEPRFLNSFMEARLVHDLNYGVSKPGMSGMYFNEDSSFFDKPNWQPFKREDAFNHFLQLRKRVNYWEDMRWKSIQRNKQ